jgi:hypothetical protein
MTKKLAHYTCVCISLIFVAPASGAAAASPADVPRAERSLAKIPVAAPDFGDLEKSRSILAKARETNEDIYANLHSFVCNERIQRFKGSLRAEAGKQIDTVSAIVSFENGTEHYSDIQQNERSRPSMSAISGAWSEGEFGTLLRQTQLLLSTQVPVFENFADLDGTPTAVYQMEVNQIDSPWDLQVRSQHYSVPFRTRVWVSQTSGEILKIQRTSTSMPSQVGISEISWNVTLKQVGLNGKAWLLPSEGEYAVSYAASNHREWNVMNFSSYRRYGSEVAIRFQ